MDLLTDFILPGLESVKQDIEQVAQDKLVHFPYMTVCVPIIIRLHHLSLRALLNSSLRIAVAKSVNTKRMNRKSRITHCDYCITH